MSKRGIGLDQNGNIQKKKRKNYFFGIGISSYENFTDLPNAVKDVEDIRKLLVKDFDFSESRTKVLTNKDASRENIINELQGYTKELKEGDNLIIYFSGHGQTINVNKENSRGYWVPQDAKKGTVAHLIRNSTLKDYLKDINAHHTLIIADACFSGSFFQVGVRSDDTFDNMNNRISRWAFASGRDDEFAFDGPEGENSPFASSLIDILENCPTEGINFSLLVDQVTKLTSAKTNRIQNPEGNPIFDCGHKGGQFVFVPKNFEARPLVELPQKDIVEAITPWYREWIKPAILGLILLVGSVSGHYYFTNSGGTIDPPTPVEEEIVNILEFEDKRDGLKYPYFKAKDGNYWMASNLKFKTTEGAFSPEFKDSLVNEYGYLYTWDAAKKACPDGWKLPSNQEWIQFFMAYGGYQEFGGPVYNDPKKSFKSLLSGGDSGFDAKLSGMIFEGEDAENLDYNVVYWSKDTIDIDPENRPETGVHTFNLTIGDSMVYKSYDYSNFGLACRCIKEK